MSKKKVLVFLDICIDGDPLERMGFELFTDAAPKTAENFRALCTGEKGISPKTGAPLHYKGTFFHQIVKGSVAQAGDLLRKDGNYGESIYGGKFPDESPKLKHDSSGLLTMAIADRDTRGSLFMITFNEAHHLDRKCIVFGKLFKGHEVLKKIENAGNEEGKPDVTVKIVNSGEMHGSRRKRKHKKSSKERRKKRRRHYTPESDSSTDSDSKSSDSDSGSDSDSDSDSPISSSSDTCSSSYERRSRKRKRSKREKHRRGKRRDKRRERMRKKREKKLKRKLKSTPKGPLIPFKEGVDSHQFSFSSDGHSEGESKSNSEGDAKVHGLEGEYKNTGKITDGNQSHSIEDRQAASVNQKKGETTAAPMETEVNEFPKENGGHKNNVVTRDRSDKSPERQPDVVDNSPSKSRSRSPSPPKRALSKSMSISPRRSFSESPRRSVSRSASVGPTPNSHSASPVKRGSRSASRSISRSPPAKRGRSVSKSPSPPMPTNLRRGRNRSSTPRRVSRSPPRSSSKKSMKSQSRSPVRYSRSPSMSPVRTSRRSPSRSSGRGVASRRGPSRSPVRAAPYRKSQRSYSRSPVSAGRRERSPRSGRGRSSSKSPSVDGGSPKRIRRGRGFSEQYSFVRRYRSRSPVRSSYRYGRNDRDRYTSYRRSPRRYRSPKGRTPPRYRNGRSRSRSVSRSPIRYRARRHSPSPLRSHSPPGRFRPSPRAERQRSRTPSAGSRSSSRSRSPSPRLGSREKSVSRSRSPPAKGGLVSYGDGSPDSSRD